MEEDKEEDRDRRGDDDVARGELLRGDGAGLRLRRGERGRARGEEGGFFFFLLVSSLLSSLTLPVVVGAGGCSCCCCCCCCCCCRS